MYDDFVNWIDKKLSHERDVYMSHLNTKFHSMMLEHDVNAATCKNLELICLSKSHKLSTHDNNCDWITLFSTSVFRQTKRKKNSFAVCIFCVYVSNFYFFFAFFFIFLFLFLFVVVVLVVMMCVHTKREKKIHKLKMAQRSQCIDE